MRARSPTRGWPSSTATAASSPPTARWCSRAHEPARQGGAMTEIGKPVPQPTPESQPYWDGCLRGELLYQRCVSCGRAQFYPRSACAS
ncbi:MAG: zinc ribbon domain-containing protein, partial [candidate division NC10 bacterium]